MAKATKKGLDVNYIAIGALSVVGGIGLWSLAAYLNPTTLPGPLAVVHRFIDLFQKGTWQTDVAAHTHKYIHYYNDGLGSPGSSDRIFPEEFELYDLVADPAELNNVVDDPGYADVLADLRARLAELQAQYGDQPYMGPDTPRLDWSV